MEIRSIEIPTPHGSVAGTLVEAGTSGEAGILLAHGAGLGQRHEWMVAVRDRLADRGHTVMTFDYLYMHEGRKAPDRLPKLLDVHEAAANVIAGVVDHVVLVGKSMGGRVGSHLAADGRVRAAGLAYLGYPLVAMGKTEPRDVAHLRAIEAPQLFVSGTRDRMGPATAIGEVAESVPRGRVVLIEDGDHSFVPRKASGLTLDDNLDAAIDAVDAWMGENL